MADYEKIRALNEPLDSGGLTQAEFEPEKANVLTENTTTASLPKRGHGTQATEQRHAGRPTATNRAAPDGNEKVNHPKKEG